jgi:hypothetical protein
MIGQAFANSQPIAIDKGQIGQNSIRPFHVNIPEAAVLVASLLANSCVVMATSVGVKGSSPRAPVFGDDGGGQSDSLQWNYPDGAALRALHDSQAPVFVLTLRRQLSPPRQSDRLSMAARHCGRPSVRWTA